MHSPIIAYVPSNIVKIVLTQLDTYGKKGRWITKILEFNLDIRPTKLVKGQGLAKLLTESNCKILGINTIMQLLGEKNPQELSQISGENNLQEPSYILGEKNPQEPSQILGEKNPQGPSQISGEKNHKDLLKF